MRNSKYDKEANDRYREKMKAQGYLYRGMWIDRDTFKTIKTLNDTVKGLSEDSKKHFLGFIEKAAHNRQAR